VRPLSCSHSPTLAAQFEIFAFFHFFVKRTLKIACVVMRMSMTRRKGGGKEEKEEEKQLTVEEVPLWPCLPFNDSAFFST